MRKKGKKFLGVLLAAVLLVNMPVVHASNNTVSDNFRVATFNIAAGRKPNIEAISSALEQENIDVVGVQEVDINTGRNNYDMLAKFKEYNYIKDTHFQKSINYSGGEYGIGLLTRYQFTEKSGGALSNEGSYEARAYVRGVFEKDGKEVAIYNTHLTHESQSLRAKQMEEVLNVMEADPTPYKILTGDFNTDQSIKENYPMMKNYNLANGKDGVWYNTCAHGDSMKIDSIDNIVTSRNIKVNEVKMVETGLSDHNMLYIDCQLLDQEEPSRQLLDYTIKDVESISGDVYTEQSYAILSEALNEANELLDGATQEQIDAMIDNLDKAVSQLQKQGPIGGYSSFDFDSSKKQFVAMDASLSYIPNTMEAWVKLDTNPNKRQIILGNYRGTTYPAFSIEITANNQLRYFEQIIENGKKVEYDVRTTDFSCNDQWTHIAVVRDPANKTISLLVDGEVRASKTFSDVKEKPALTDAHFVGTDHRKSYFLDGEINTIRLWNQTKTAKEVLADMNLRLTGTENGLYHAWRFDENDLTSEAKVFDLAAENKLNATASGFEIPQNDEFTSFDFNSSKKQFVAVDASLSYIPNTMEAWVKLDTNPNKRQIILGNYRGTTYPAFSIEITADNQLRYFEQVIENGVKTECDIRTTDFSCNDQWTHIAVVRDPANKMVSLLVNGEVRASKTSNVIKEKSALSDAHFVGTDHRKSYFLDGEINTICLWNQTKTVEEVLADMNLKLTGTENGLYHAWKFNEADLTIEGKVYDLVAKDSLDATVFGFESLEHKILNLKNKITEYEQLISNSDVSQEKKDVFTAVINEVEAGLETVTSLQEVKELDEKLQKAYSDFGKPADGKLEFVVLSDTHVQSSASSTSARIYDEGLNKIVTTMPNAKAVVNCGDFSSDGADSEFARYYSIIDKYDENLQFVNALGNHDVRWTSQGWDGVYDRYMSYNQKYMGDTDKVYYDTWIGEGEDQYHFVVINTEWDIKDSSYISSEQLEWLDKTMAEGAEDDKPIFVVLHEPLRNTIADTDSYNGYSDFPLDEGPQDFALKEVLRKYPQSIILTGHVHAGLGTNEIVETDYGTLVSVPSYLRADSGDPQNQLGYYVSVYDGKVQLSMYDFEHEAWLPAYHYTVDLTDEVPAGKVLDVNFDDETANDTSGNNNNGKLVGDIEFVDGVKGKAIHIVNDETAVEAKQYVDFGKVEDLRFGKEDFTIMFWYKGTKEMDTEGAVISNKDWDSGANPGFAIGTFTDPRPGIGLNFTVEGSSRKDTGRYSSATDGKWHHIAATFDRDGMMTLYIDGKKVDSTSISADLGKTIDVNDLNLILGADGNKHYPVNDSYIDELKIYKKVIEAYELESVVAPYKVEAGEDKATITWEALDDKFTPAYILFNGEKLTIDSEAGSYEITGLTANTKYTIEVITRDKAYSRNLVFGHEIEFKTTGKVDFTVLNDVIAKAEGVDKEQYTASSAGDLENALIEAKALLDNQNTTQEEVAAMITKLQTAIDSLVPVENIETNKASLAIAIEMAEKASLENVVPVVVNEFEAALQEAKGIIANDKATQEQVDASFARLSVAMHMLEFYKGDKTELQSLVDATADLVEENYTEESWTVLQEALVEANTALENENAMQEEVDEAYDKLQAAIEGLEEAEVVDKTLLEAMVNKVLGLQEDKYISSTWQTMLPVLETAQEVLASEEAGQLEVDSAYEGLVRVYLDLRLKPNKDVLNDLIQQANGLNKASYSAKTWNVMQDALDKAKAVLDDPEASQAEVDNAKEVLTKAMAGLETSNSVKASVATGDDSLVGLFAGLSLLSMVTVIKKRKINIKRRN